MLDFVLPAPIGINLVETPNDHLVSFEMVVDRQSDFMLPDLELQLLKTQQQQDGKLVLAAKLYFFYITLFHMDWLFLRCGSSAHAINAVELTEVVNCLGPSHLDKHLFLRQRKKI